MKTLKELLKEINEWQDSVFTKATPLSAVKHLEREVEELKYSIAHNPTVEEQNEELADCFILLAGVAHLLELDLVDAVNKKMEVNRRRVWGEPDSEGVVEHVREGKTLLQVFVEDGFISENSENKILQIINMEIREDKENSSV